MEKQLTVMGERVLEFLKDKNREIFRELKAENGKDKYYITVAKVKYGNNFIRIYVANESYYGMKDLEYSGIMDTKTGKFYDTKYNLTSLGIKSDLDLHEIRGEITKKIDQRLKEIAIETGLKNIEKFRPSKEEIKDELFFNRTEEHSEWRTKEEGKDLYLTDKTMDDIEFHIPYPNIEKDTGNDELLLRYINGEENLVEEIVNKLLTEKKELIYNNFKYYLRVRKHLQDFILGIAKETEMFDRIKQIRKACEGKKTVTVKYEKEGKIWEGKVTVGERWGASILGLGNIQESLEDYRMSSYNIGAKDRKVFEEMFGRWADLDLAHITGIKYNGKECLA